MSDTRAEIIWYLMVEVVMFAFAAMAHGGLLMTGHEFPKAATAETVIAVLLGAGLIMSLVSPPHTRTVALITQGLALLGVVTGLIFIAVGSGPRSLANLLVFGIMLLTLAFGFAVAKRGVTT
jgi:hypothetical protein